ncbi:hypothetical protein AAMO2058_001279000 [Amorphochlora amoebiformis]
MESLGLEWAYPMAKYIRRVLFMIPIGRVKDDSALFASIPSGNMRKKKGFLCPRYHYIRTTLGRPKMKYRWVCYIYGQNMVYGYEKTKEERKLKKG